MFELLICLILLVYGLAVYFLMFIKHYTKTPQMYFDKEEKKFKFSREFKL